MFSLWTFSIRIQLFSQKFSGQILENFRTTSGQILERSKRIPDSSCHFFSISDIFRNIEHFLAFFDTFLFFVKVWYDPLEQPGRKKWRAWYSAFTTCSKPKATVPFCNNAPQTCGTTNVKGGSRGSGFLYAESDDGINWVKPSLG